MDTSEKMEQMKKLHMNWLEEKVQAAAVWETSNLHHKIKVDHILSHDFPDYEAFRDQVTRKPYTEMLTEYAPNPPLFINSKIQCMLCGVLRVC